MCMHGEWVMLSVAAKYNLLAILSMADMVCFACMHKLWRPRTVPGLYIWYVWVCMVYGLYGMLEYKLCCVILFLLNMVGMD